MRFFTNTDSLVYEIETKNVYDDFSKNKEIFDFSNYSVKTKYHHDLNELDFGKMKDEIGSVAIEGFFGLKLKVHSILVYGSSEHKEAKSVNKNIFAKISHNESRDVE